MQSSCDYPTIVRIDHSYMLLCWAYLPIHRDFPALGIVTLVYTEGISQHVWTHWSCKQFELLTNYSILRLVVEKVSL